MHSSPTSPTEPVFIDALPLLLATLPQLSPGQLIKVPDVSLLDLMGAVEIMDARTDSYLAIDSTSTGSQNVSFDAQLELLPQELLWILDELLRLEMSFQAGSPLISTLFTCHYIRPLALASLSQTTSPAQFQSHEKSQEKDKQKGLREVVLRAMLMGFIKCAEMSWEEMCTGGVYDNEDVSLSLSSLSFPLLLSSFFPPPPVSPLRMPFQSSSTSTEEELPIIGVDVVLAALDEALVWVDENVEEAGIKEALTGRLAVRIDLTYSLALLSSPSQSSSNAIQTHLSRILLWIPALLSPSPPLPSFIPTPALEAIFKQGKEKPLSSQQPVRVIEFDPVGLSWENLGALVREVVEGCEMWSAWDGNAEQEGVGWKGIREYLTFVSRRKMSALARSIHQSLLQTNRQLFTSSPPLALSTSFFETLIVLPRSLFDTLLEIRSVETKFDDPARRVLGFMDRVGGVLVGGGRWACANRARGRRGLVKNLGGVTQLVDEAQALLPLFDLLLPRCQLTLLHPSLSLLPQALQTLLLSQILDILFSGFELSLYTPSEWTRSWWVAERTLERLERVYEGLLSGREGGSLGGDEGYVGAKVWEGKGLRALCRASILSNILSPPPTPKIISPFLHMNEPELMDRTAFQRRFKFLKGSMGGNERLDELANFDEFRKEMEELEGKSKKELTTLAIAQYTLAIECFTSYGSIPLATRGWTIRPEFPLRWLGAIRRTCFANLNWLESFRKRASDGEEITGKESVSALKWDSDWFPTWS